MFGHKDLFIIRILSSILGLRLTMWEKKKMGEEDEKGKV